MSVFGQLLAAEEALRTVTDAARVVVGRYGLDLEHVLAAQEMKESE